ncbi:MFS transporter [Actinocorallia herbida]|uniref:MFS transporter n=1 Tax=Actinocorallia herbida TaxID=58109 RepID=A0A3N1CY25_9ACTN|nr:MFS transporter [Actinocorallia herbida]ROO85628.1 MFS transporter [Actinocorallia herbida]
MSEQTAPTGRTHGPGDRPPDVSFRWMSLLALVQLGVIMASNASTQILLPSHVERIDAAHKESSLALVFAVGAIVTAIANPLAGALSDRTRTRFGRRRPWVVGGSLLGAASLGFLGGQESIAGLVLGWSLAQLAFTLVQATAVAAVPDQVPVGQRGRASALAGVAVLIGPLIGGAVVTFAVQDLFAGYLAMGALLLVAALPFPLRYREPALPPPGPRPSIWSGLWVSPRRHPDFAWAWLSRFLVNLALSMGIGYLLYYLRDSVQYERLFPGSTNQQGVLIMVTVFSLSSVLPGLAAGWWSDRSGRTRVVVFLGGTVMALAALTLAVGDSWTTALVAAGLLGAGTGVFVSVDQAMVTRLLPAGADRGKDLGVISLATALGFVLGPVVAAPLVTSPGGYPLMFGVAALAALTGAALVWRIRGVR